MSTSKMGETNNNINKEIEEDSKLQMNEQGFSNLIRFQLLQNLLTWSGDSIINVPQFFIFSISNILSPSKRDFHSKQSVLYFVGFVRVECQNEKEHCHHRLYSSLPLVLLLALKLLDHGKFELRLKKCWSRRHNHNINVALEKKSCWRTNNCFKHHLREDWQWQFKKRNTDDCWVTAS